MTHDILLKLIEFLISVGIIVVIRYIIPFANAKISQSKYAFVYNAIKDAVNSAEQTFPVPKSGEEKKKYAIDLATEICQKNGIKLSRDEIGNLIESAVYTLKQEQKAQAAK